MAVSVGLLVAACGGDDGSSVAVSPTQPTAVAAPSTYTPPSSVAGVGPLSFTPEPGEETLTVERPNGDAVAIPALRGLADPTAFGESAVAAIATYFVSGDVSALAGFEGEAVPFVENMRSELFLQGFDAVASIPTAGNFQFVFHDTLEAPARWEVAPLTSSVQFAGGDLVMQLSDDEVWQGLNSTAPWKAQYKVEQLDFVIEERGDEIVITGLAVSFDALVE